MMIKTRVTQVLTLLIAKVTKILLKYHVFNSVSY